MTGKSVGKNTILVATSIVLAIALIEVFLRLISHEMTFVGKFATKPYASYTKEELDPNINLDGTPSGATCVRKSIDNFWHPYYGINFIKIDKDCITKLFGSSRKRMVFMGGSVMANVGAPNYLTGIDHYVHAEISGLASINLAEGGWRSTNEMIRLLLDVVELKPDVVIFLDGYNEFNSIQNDLGRHDEDIYSTAYKVRIEHTAADLFSRMISRTDSHLLKLIFFQTGLIRSSYSARSIIPSDRQIYQAAQLYLENTYKISIICSHYGIKSIFFLQPDVFSKQLKTSEEIEIANYWARKEPGRQRTNAIAYDYIIKNSKVPIINLRESIDTHEMVYLDVCHLNKVGNAILAKNMARHLKNAFQ
jgi:hypothetical protein